jgi:hypothetical protein
MFENRMLRIFGPRKDEVTGGVRKLHNEELHNLHSSSCIIRMIEPRAMRCRRLVGKPEGKRPLGRQRYRLIRRRLKLILERWDGEEWIDKLAQSQTS